MLARVQPSALDTDVAIETPEHIVFRYRLAGPSRRFLAFLLDLAICYGSLAAVGVLVLLAAAGGAAVSGATENLLGAGAGLLMFLFFVSQWVYFAVLESWRGRTPGKAALGLRVVTVTGRPIGFRAAALRNVLRAADALPLGYMAGILSVAGLLSMSATRRFQRLGDLVAGTMVIVAERASATAPLALWPPAQPFEVMQLPDTVRLDAEERLAIELFLRRRARLGQGREFELASMIAPLLAARLGFRPQDPRSASDPARVLALLYDRASNAGRTEAPPSSRTPGSWR
jgi:uncharacterized RDD family membrane protein YckC